MININNNQNLASEVESLSFSKTAKIALKGIKIRLWRSLILIACINLAIAFLSYILTSNSLQRNLETHASKELIEKLIRTGNYDPDNIQNQNIQTYWLLTLAVLISFVGIVNAMLMSVSERFREIGTMKCLGALDSFVLKLFLIESAFIGTVGSISGGLIGIILAFIEGSFTYGKEVFNLSNNSVIISVFILSSVIGITITILGALYPAYQASKMKPVVALRAEL
ncbi:MAG TPA: FtsX-like permease family protein [Victivallales bacterium]|nr:FtsX-like permease family protein [Victivallales bacterium]HPO91210.1 FtsX-like permease family protein [Victivallales bacterium]HRR29304.1 FtsX-like permease family protein [Victivallales bacterium]